MRRATDWPFCHSRQGKINAVVWTGKKHRLFATKAKAEKAVRSWKTWKERHGWETRKLDSGYLAQKDGLREWCGTHVYDFDSRKRL